MTKPGNKKRKVDAVSVQAPTEGAPEQQQSLDAIKQLYVGDDPTDYTKWMMLLEYIIKTQNEDDIRNIFDSYLRVFRNDGKVFRAYIEFELARENRGKVKELFEKSLPKVYDVDLWLCYIEFVKKANDVVIGGEEARNTVLQSYNFAIDMVGLDFLNSQPLWTDYITFLTNWVPANSNESKSKVELTRQLIRKTISLPLKYLEDNWKLYTTFENETDPSTARRFINEKSQEYMKLRPLVQELSNITKGIKPITNRVYLKKQLNYWTDWINWEKQNKLKLPQDQLEKRINHVYRLSTEYLRFHPEVWYNYSCYLSTVRDKIPKMLELIQDGLILNPQSFTLTYQISNYYERESNLEEVTKCWTDLIESLVLSYNKLTDTDKKSSMSRTITNAYSYLMKASKRISGLSQARQIFSKSRKFEGITWHIFVDYAFIEYHTKDSIIASKAFELGFKRFNKDFGFIDTYLNFLISIQDLSNCKRILESSLENLQNDQESLLKLFEKYLKIELNFGDANSVKLLENRFLDKFPDKFPFGLALSGFSSEFDSFNPIRLTDQYTSPIPTMLSKGSINQDAEYSPSFNEVEEVSANNGASMAQPFGNNAQLHKPFNVGDEVYNILRVLPRAEYYKDKPEIFNCRKVVEFLKKLDL